MKMPGFTAEASLYETRGHYRMATSDTSAVLVEAQAIFPQGWCKVGGRWVPCFAVDPRTWWDANAFELRPPMEDKGHTWEPIQ